MLAFGKVLASDVAHHTVSYGRWYHSAAQISECCKILKVPRSASSKQIKKAYLDVVRVHHPDVNNSPESQKIFRESQEAFNILSKVNLSDVRWDEGGIRRAPKAKSTADQNNHDHFESMRLKEEILKKRKRMEKTGGEFDPEDVEENFRRDLARSLKQTKLFLRIALVLPMIFIMFQLTILDTNESQKEWIKRQKRTEEIEFRMSAEYARQVNAERAESNRKQIEWQQQRSESTRS